MCPQVLPRKKRARFLTPNNEEHSSQTTSQSTLTSDDGKMKCEDLVRQCLEESLSRESLIKKLSVLALRSRKNAIQSSPKRLALVCDAVLSRLGDDDCEKLLKGMGDLLDKAEVVKNLTDLEKYVEVCIDQSISCQYKSAQSRGAALICFIRILHVRKDEIAIKIGENSTLEAAVHRIAHEFNDGNFDDYGLETTALDCLYILWRSLVKDNKAQATALLNVLPETLKDCLLKVRQDTRGRSSDKKKHFQKIWIAAQREALIALQDRSKQGPPMSMRLKVLSIRASWLPGQPDIDIFSDVQYADFSKVRMHFGPDLVIEYRNTKKMEIIDTAGPHLHFDIVHGGRPIVQRLEPDLRPPKGYARSISIRVWLFGGTEEVAKLKSAAMHWDMPSDNLIIAHMSQSSQVPSEDIFLAQESPRTIGSALHPSQMLSPPPLIIQRKGPRHFLASTEDKDFEPSPQQQDEALEGARYCVPKAPVRIMTVPNVKKRNKISLPKIDEHPPLTQAPVAYDDDEVSEKLIPPDNEDSTAVRLFVDEDIEASPPHNHIQQQPQALSLQKTLTALFNLLPSAQDRTPSQRPLTQSSVVTATPKNKRPKLPLVDDGNQAAETSSLIEEDDDTTAVIQGNASLAELDIIQLAEVISRADQGLGLESAVCAARRALRDPRYYQGWKKLHAATQAQSNADAIDIYNMAHAVLTLVSFFVHEYKHFQEQDVHEMPFYHG